MIMASTEHGLTGVTSMDNGEAGEQIHGRAKAGGHHSFGHHSRAEALKIIRDLGIPVEGDRAGGEPHEHFLAMCARQR